MRGNCDLDLRLSPSSSSPSSEPPSLFLHHHHHRRRPMVEEISNESPQNQKITIFYNGKICVSDVTEFQGKAILMLAAKEMEERLKAAPPNSPNNQSQPSNPPNHSLRMRRSLQTFLQKRKNRIQSASPYHHR